MYPGYGISGHIKGIARGVNRGFPDFSPEKSVFWGARFSLLLAVF
jgi:hypothetical protein